jgi:hypothetical protein
MSNLVVVSLRSVGSSDLKIIDDDFYLAWVNHIHGILDRKKKFYARQAEQPFVSCFALTITTSKN